MKCRIKELETQVSCLLKETEKMAVLSKKENKDIDDCLHQCSTKCSLNFIYLYCKHHFSVLK